jgi:outer membrane autotransporter protein
VSRLGTVSRLAAALLATTCLTPIVVAAVSASALAEGGQGVGGGAGGADSLGGAGGAGGDSAAGGGGGGAGMTGGQGGNGASGTGGLGGQSAGANGQNGTGSSGGGGGAHGVVLSGPGSIGAGLAGGNGGAGGAAGGGGAGGYGAAVTGSGAFTYSGSVLGGSGGSGNSGGSGGTGIAFGTSGSTLGTSGAIGGGTGGQGADVGGNGGVGVSGAGLQINNTGAIGGGSGGEGIIAGNGGDGISGSGLMVNNSVGATISGGIGGLAPEGHAGSGGAGISGSSSTINNSGSVGGGAGGAFDGSGGAGITGSGLTVINTATGQIAGGLNIGGGRANAIAFTGGTNVLELQAGSTITGNVVAFGPGDTLRLGGSTNSSFDVSTIGAAQQYQNFGIFEKSGTSTWTLTGTDTAQRAWAVNGGALAVDTSSLTGNAALAAGTAITFNQTVDGIYFGAISGDGSLTKTGSGVLTLIGSNSYTGGTTLNGGTLQLGVSGGPQGNIVGSVTVSNGTLNVNSADTTGITSLTVGFGNTVNFNNANSAGSAVITNGNLINFNNSSTAGTASITNNGQISFKSTASAGGAQIVNNVSLQFSNSASLGTATVTNAAAGTMGFANTASAGAGTISNAGLLFFQNSATAAAATITTESGGVTRIRTGASGGAARFIIDAGGGLDISETTAGTTAGSIEGAGNLFLGSRTLTVGSNNLDTTVSGVIADVGGTISATGGGLVKIGTGSLTLSGINTYTGATTVSAGRLAVNGSLTSDVTVAAAGTLGGNGTIFGNVTNNGTAAPGNSIGTLTVTGSYTQAANSAYQVEVNALGASDLITVNGAPGTATINGGTVQVLAAAGSYGRTTTYTILSATGGRTGTFDGVTSNFAFLQPSLDYDANNVFLTLTLQGFTFNQLTPNQRAVGTSLDQAFANATGDFAAVVNTLTGLDSVQGPQALNALSGEPYADFGTLNATATAGFMNAVGQQIAAARGAPANGTRQALAQACDADACDIASPWSAWVSALGGLGSVQGNGNASTMSYNFGGAAAGIDYRFDPRILLGVAAGYTSGSLWVNSLQGRGWSDAVALVAYGSFTQAAFYVDAMAGYAHFTNRLQRQISFPGLQRTANGSTQANQAFGQVEAGYRLPVGIAKASATPFARLQLSTTTQEGFSEWGANSIDLTVAAQTTTSARGVLGVDLAGSFDMGDTRSLDFDLRLGWSHEYADTARPMTAAFAGAPTNPFTVYGASPSRDAAAVGFQARTNLSDQAQLYLRYDGEISSESDNHSLNAGVRLIW